MVAENALIVFAKPPVAGLAKTRLIPALGKDGSAEMHAKLLMHTLGSVSSPQNLENTWDTHLWCSNDPDNHFFIECEKRFGVTRHKQVGVDLGERMAHAIHTMLQSYQRVCIIGSDCPEMNSLKVSTVFSCLKTENDLAITPAEDGGYVLLAVKERLFPEIFSDIEWGGAGVFNQTISKIEALELNAKIQPTLWDVDEPVDLKRVNF